MVVAIPDSVELPPPRKEIETPKKQLSFREDILDEKDDQENAPLATGAEGMS